MDNLISTILDDDDLWFAGYIAYNYYETEVNPFPFDSHEFLKWNEGYIAAKNDECRFNCDVLF